MAHRLYLEQVDKKINRPNLSDHSRAVFVLHDQLNLQVWPQWIPKEKPLLIFMEAQAKGKSLPYHKKKLTYVLSSMRHFAIECQEKGYPVLYYSTTGHYNDGLKELLDKNKQLNISYMKPSEWETRQMLRDLNDEHPDRLTELENTFFLVDADEWVDNIKPGYRMEYFYRDMRRQTGYLMNGDEPEGGEWNYDDENRESLSDDTELPEITFFKPDEITAEVMDLVEKTFPDHFGKLENFRYAVTREQALQLLNEFIAQRLDLFGPYEDALATGEDILFHTNLSLYINNGLLSPAEVCEKAIDAYKKGDARLNSVEGLVRQIIGWREFVHIYYEAMMPEVREANYFKFTEPLPELYWTGETDMHCLSESLRPVIEQGYSHHIQRLMVLSNFSNLTQSDPRLLNRWFWFAYVDAYEWVVLPNVLGMSTYADGGVLASKPYVSSGNYITKMSDYCSDCAFSVSKKTGEGACPFNYLYWHFVDRQRKAFEDNGRAGFMVNMYEKKSDEDKKAIRESSEKFLEQLSRYD
jgi:deoxyribodipyrimidine photolyase-related protein